MRRIVAGLILAVAVLPLSGCATTSVADREYGGLPEGLVVQPGMEDVRAVWVDDARFAVVTWGSSSCPAVATELSVEAADQLTLSFVRPTDGPCTADMAPTTHEFQVPENLRERPVHLTVTWEDWDGTAQLVLE